MLVSPLLESLYSGELTQAQIPGGVLQEMYYVHVCLAQHILCTQVSYVIHHHSLSWGGGGPWVWSPQAERFPK